MRSRPRGKAGPEVLRSSTARDRAAAVPADRPASSARPAAVEARRAGWSPTDASPRTPAARRCGR